MIMSVRYLPSRLARATLLHLPYETIHASIRTERIHACAQGEARFLSRTLCVRSFLGCVRRNCVAHIGDVVYVAVPRARKWSSGGELLGHHFLICRAVLTGPFVTLLGERTELRIVEKKIVFYFRTTVLNNATTDYFAGCGYV